MSGLLLEGMKNTNESLERVMRWFHHEPTDRAPIRFWDCHSEQSNSLEVVKRKMSDYPDLKAYWFDAEARVSDYMERIKGKEFFGESFPVYYPNLGPGVYASFFGVELVYGETTSWTKHVRGGSSAIDLNHLKFDVKSETFEQIGKMTAAAVKKASGSFIVGYTDLHPSMDCVADFVGSEQLCVDLYECPDKVKEISGLACDSFPFVLEHFSKSLAGFPSVSWLGIPAMQTMHIPSCDYSSLISTAQFEEFCLPSILREVKMAPYQIFHMDGRGVARHLEILLSIPEINAIQWVQGAGRDESIFDWIPLIKRIQTSGKGIVVNLKKNELSRFMTEVKPKGIFLNVEATPQEQPDILHSIRGWI